MHGRLTWRPLAGKGPREGFSLNLFASAGRYEAGENRSRNRLIPAVAFEHKRGVVAAQYLRASDPPRSLVSRHPSLVDSTDAIVHAHGASVFGWLDLGAFGAWEGLRVMGRFDWLDPDAARDDNAHRRFIAGVGYRVNKHVNALLDAEFVDYDAAARVAKNERRVFFHVGLTF